MIDLIVFSVSNNRYALKIDNIQRIIQASELTNIPNSHELVDGMMSHEDKVIKVLNFRKMIGVESYDEELKELFIKLKAAHQDWIDELKHSVANGVAFTKTIDPHKCELGMWLDNFNSYDDKVSVILKNLMENHKHLHASGGEALEIYHNDKDSAQEIVNTTIYDTFNHTMDDIETFIEELERVANSLQKFVLYENGDENFAIKVDVIEDIAHIKESSIMNSDDKNDNNEFLKLEGVLDIDGVLVNVIKTVTIPN